MTHSGSSDPGGIPSECGSVVSTAAGSNRTLSVAGAALSVALQCAAPRATAQEMASAALAGVASNDNEVLIEKARTVPKGTTLEALKKTFGEPQAVKRLARKEDDKTKLTILRYELSAAGGARRYIEFVFDSNEALQSTRYELRDRGPHAPLYQKLRLGGLSSVKISRHFRRGEAGASAVGNSDASCSKSFRYGMGMPRSKELLAALGLLGSGGTAETPTEAYWAISFYGAHKRHLGTIQLPDAGAFAVIHRTRLERVDELRRWFGELDLCPASTGLGP